MAEDEWGAMVDKYDRLRQSASTYELAALIKALFALGFDWDSIDFEGTDELSPRRGPHIKHLRYEESPTHRAVITLNTGLLSGGSPLPEYFRSFARTLSSPDDFVLFLGFFDAVHLKDLAYCAEPSLSVGRFSRIAQAQRARINGSSPAMLHTTFRAMFPELPIAIKPVTFSRDCGAGRARLGAHLDGRTILGSGFQERFSGFRVSLHAESEAADCVGHWESEAQRRIALIERTLTKLKRAVEVVISFDSYRHGQKLVQSAQQRQLGVRPWLTNTRGQLYGEGTVVLWRSWDLPTAAAS